MFKAIASPAAAVLCKLDDSHPKRGGMQENEPAAATMRQPYRALYASGGSTAEARKPMAPTVAKMAE